MDEINGFRCICPLGRTGARCQECKYAGGNLWGAGFLSRRSNSPSLRPLISPSLCSRRCWEELPPRRAPVSPQQPLGGGVQQLPMPGWQSGLYQGERRTSGPLHRLVEGGEGKKVVVSSSISVISGAVRPSALPASPARPGSRTAAVPGGTEVCGARLPPLLLWPLPGLGGLLRGRRHASAGGHRVPAQRQASGQQLRAHHAGFQQGQSPTGECPGTTALQPVNRLEI